MQRAAEHLLINDGNIETHIRITFQITVSTT